MDSRLQRHPLGFYEVVNKPSIQELQKYYADQHYQEARGSYEHKYSKEELNYFQAKLTQRYSALLSVQPKQKEGLRLLDVGCGEGFSLAFFREKGYQVKGIDFSSAGIQSKNPSCMDVLVTGDAFSLLEEEIKSGNKYDVVWLQNVLEHVMDPILLLKLLRQLVSAKGIVVASVPNDFTDIQHSALERKYINDSYWVNIPRHLSYFNRESLMNVIKETKWMCVDMLSDFPIDWYLYHAGSNYIKDKSLGKEAHLARVQIENLIAQNPIEHVLDFLRSLAKLGMGRVITAYLKPEK